MLTNSRTLGSSKTYKVFLFGFKSTGKTTILEKLIFGNRSNHQKNTETIDDIYIAYVDNERGQKEKIWFYDTCGIDNTSFNNSETIKNYIYSSDAIVLVYSVSDFTSFAILDSFKKLIDRIKEKKELPIICLGNKLDDKHDKQVDYSKALSWANKEKIKLFEVASFDRKSLIEPFTHISSRLNQPQNKSTFTQLSKLKAKAGNSNYSIEL